MRGATIEGRRTWAVDPRVLVGQQDECRARAENAGVAAARIAEVRWFVAHDGSIYRALVCR